MILIVWIFLLDTPLGIFNLDASIYSNKRLHGSNHYLFGETSFATKKIAKKVIFDIEIKIAIIEISIRLTFNKF